MYEYTAVWICSVKSGLPRAEDAVFKVVIQTFESMKASEVQKSVTVDR